MSLDDILYETLDTVHGARFVGLVGTDGLGIRAAISEDDEGYDLELAELEIAALAASAAAAAGRIGSGTLQTLSIETEDMTYLAALVAPGYYAALCIRSDANVERGRAALHRMAERIQIEL